MNRELAVFSLVIMLAGCAVEDGRDGSHGDIEGAAPVDDDELRLSADGTMHLLPGEPDPRLPGNAPEATPLPAMGNPCDQPAKVLVFGDDTLARAGLVPALRNLGADVTDGPSLPQDLTGYDAVFHVGFNVPLTSAEHGRLALFLEFGGAVHLTGERPCCEAVNGSHTAFVRQVVVGGENITIGRQGDIRSLFGDFFFPYAINAGAKSGLATTPNAVSQIRLVSPGGIAGVAGDNVLLTGQNDAVVGAVWDKNDLVGRGGRLTVIMDTNWLNSLTFADNLELLQNMLGFMCGATAADEDQDGVPARLDCDDLDPTVGDFLFEDDFSQDTGFFSPTPQRNAPWGWEDGVTFASAGGQQVQLGQPQDWGDVVVFAKLAARGTRANCGRDPGQEACSGTDRWRAGVVVRAAADDDQDEGYHGYRCALSSNAVNGCFEDGLFLQIGEFMDAPEDDIDSECSQPGNCPENTTFDQLGRQNHDLFDLGAGDSGYITFYAVGQNMYCEAAGEDGQVVSVTGTSDSFATGTVALSTLNIYGEFDHLRVCKALALPGQVSLP